MHRLLWQPTGQLVLQCTCVGIASSAEALKPPHGAASRPGLARARASNEIAAFTLFCDTNQPCPLTRRLSSAVPICAMMDTGILPHQAATTSVWPSPQSRRQLQKVQRFFRSWASNFTARRRADKQERLLPGSSSSRVALQRPPLPTRRARPGELLGVILIRSAPGDTAL